MLTLPFQSSIVPPNSLLWAIRTKVHQESLSCWDGKSTSLWTIVSKAPRKKLPSTSEWEYLGRWDKKGKKHWMKEWRIGLESWLWATITMWLSHFSFVSFNFLIIKVEMIIPTLPILSGCCNRWDGSKGHTL